MVGPALPGEAWQGLAVPRGMKFGQAAFETEVAGRLVSEEPIAVGESAAVQFVKKCLSGGRITAGTIAVYAGPVARPLDTPIERTHDAVGVAGGEMVLPAVDPVTIQAHGGIQYSKA
jgi:hypothetical protein